MKQIDISILIQIFNEEDSISELYNELLSELPTNSIYEIIFINDGSSDNSSNEISHILQKDNNVKLINFFINGGKSEALSLGFRKASGDIIITIDGDLQDDPSEIKNLIDKIHSGSDMVTGWKKDRKDSLSKKIQSKIFNFTVLKDLMNLQI